MSRFKTFDSTGIATSGRLYAGDLNAIQDRYADIANFAQTVDIATLRLGATDVQLSRFGTNEAQFSGHLRALGILRGLGGIIPGAFTTAQRDAISPGSRPYGMEILNTTTNQREWNSGTDAVPVWTSFNAVETWRTVAQWVAIASAGAGTTVYMTNPPAQSNIPGVSALRHSLGYWIDPADYAVPGKATKFKIKLWVATNDTAPAVNFGGSLGRLVGAAGATTPRPTSISSVGTTPSITAPAADTIATVDGVEFTMSTAGVYVAAASLSGALAANAVVDMGISLLVHNN